MEGFFYVQCGKNYLKFIKITERRFKMFHVKHFILTLRILYQPASIRLTLYNILKGTIYMPTIFPKDYRSTLSVKDTEQAIRYIRETFQDEFGEQMNLSRLTAPMFVSQESGLNDNLNGVETPVSFTMKELPGKTIEIVHSLVKWKRDALRRYSFGIHEGLYTNMNAIRKDEDLDNFHSVYVDQWDWEKVITKDERNFDTLEATVQQIFKVIKHMEDEVWYKYPQA